MAEIGTLIHPLAELRRWLPVVVCVIAAAATLPAAAFSTEGVRWQNGATTFSPLLVHGSQIESSDVSQAIADWNNASAFHFTDTGGTADPCNSTMPNGVDIATTNCGDAFGSGVLAVTTYETAGGGFLTHAGIVFNSNTTFGSYDGPLRFGSVDFRRVALHELGHVLGLDHENDPSIPAIMAPAVTDIDRLTADDIAGVQSIYGVTGGSQTTIVSAMLPSSRSVQVGVAATAFASIINAGTQPATACSIALGTPIAANFSYQTTDPVTNLPVGTLNRPVDIPAGLPQSFIISVTPTAALATATNIVFTMKCSNTPTASSTVGLNTLLLSASDTPTPDIVSLAATIHNDGYVGVIGGSGAFAVATVNVGVAGNIIASADTGSSRLPVSIMICQTDPPSGQCITPIQSSVPATIAANATPTFAVFVYTTSPIAPDPANKRIFVRFRDAVGGTTRGSTSVAISSLE